MRETTPAETTKLLTATFVLSGLRLPRDIALQVFHGVHAMRESTTYQYILDEGRIDEAQKILLRMGRKEFGPPGEAIQSALTAIVDLERLERMTDEFLEVNSWQDLLATP